MKWSKQKVLTGG